MPPPLPQSVFVESFHPFSRISVNISPAFLIGCFIAQNRLIEGCLEYFSARRSICQIASACRQRLVCTYHIHQRRVGTCPCCFPCKPDDRMDMVRHDDILVNLNAGIPLFQCKQLLLDNPAKCCQNHNRFGGGKTPPYTGQCRHVGLHMNCHIIVSGKAVIVLFQPGMLSFWVLFHI